MILGSSILGSAILAGGSGGATISFTIVDPWEELDFTEARWNAKQGDRLPVMRARLRQKNSAPIYWPGATVLFIYKRKGQAAVSKAATILSYTSIEALVEVVWEEEDFATAGEFPAEFEATLASGKVHTFPKGGYITMVVTPDLR